MKGLSLISANGSPLDIKIAHVVDFYLGHVLLRGVFVLVNKLSSHVIIGMNIILKAGITLKAGTTDVIVKGEQVSFSPPDTSGGEVGWVEADICATRGGHINYNEVLKVRCCLCNTADKSKFVGPNTPFVGNIRGLPVYSTTEDDGSCVLLLPNTSMETLMIRRDQVISGAQEMSLFKVQEIDEEWVTNVFAVNAKERGPPVTQQRTSGPKWTDHKKEKEMENLVDRAIGDNTPFNRAKDKKVLMEYANVFSTDSLTWVSLMRSSTTSN